MITSLLINDEEYKDLILEGETNLLKITVEMETNTPSSSSYKVTLLNESSIQDAILGESNYPDVEDATCKLYNDDDKVFEGKLNRKNSDIDTRNEVLSLSFTGIEQDLGKRLSEYDLTQIYYDIASECPVRQRGGRQSGVRFNPSESHRIDLMVKEIFKDLGFTESNILFGYDNNEVLKYKYNSNKYGDITKQHSVSKLRNEGNRKAWNTLFNRILPLASTEENSNSYNTLLKEFATICGCIYFYDYRTDTIVFMKRNFDLMSTDWYPHGIRRNYNLTALMLDEDCPIKYNQMYDSIAFKFSDITLMLRLKDTSPNPDTGFEYGIDKGEYEIKFYPGQSDNYYLYLPDSDFILGPVEINQSLQCRNSFVIEMDAQLKDYIQTGPESNPAHVQEFLRSIYSNYKFVLLKNREQTVTINGLYFAPFRAILPSATENIFSTETDFNKEETKLTIEWADYVY